jgi:PAS domain-containing protein
MKDLHLQENQSSWRQLLEGVPIGISFHDATGQMIYANQVAQNLLNLQIVPETTIEQ